MVDRWTAEGAVLCCDAVPELWGMMKSDGRAAYKVRCPRCFAEGPELPDEDSAVGWWNRKRAGGAGDDNNGTGGDET